MCAPERATTQGSPLQIYLSFDHLLKQILEIIAYKFNVENKVYKLVAFRSICTCFSADNAGIVPTPNPILGKNIGM